MAGRPVTIIHAVVVGTTPAWCPTCLLSSAVAVTFAVEVDGVPDRLWTVHGCPDCRWTDDPTVRIQRGGS